MRAVHGTTSQGTPYVGLIDDDNKTVLRAYPSPDGKRIRIVLPELKSASQCVGHIEGDAKYFEFTR